MSLFAQLVWLAPAAPSRNMARGATPGGAATDGRRLTAGEIAGADDEALALLAATGDSRALAEIVRRHGGRLRSLALRFAGGSADADDIVQETFLSFWRTAKRWTPGGPPLGAYLTRIAINRAIDRDRRRRLRRFLGLETAAEIPDREAAIDELHEQKATLAAVTRDIAALPARQRAAILLAAGGEMTTADIAAALNLSEGAVEQLLVRARRTLRLRLAEREG